MGTCPTEGYGGCGNVCTQGKRHNGKPLFEDGLEHKPALSAPCYYEIISQCNAYLPVLASRGKSKNNKAIKVSCKSAATMVFLPDHNLNYSAAICARKEEAIREGSFSGFCSGVEKPEDPPARPEERGM